MKIWLRYGHIRSHPTIQYRGFWPILGIFDLPVTFFCFNLQKTLEKKICAEKLIFIVKVFLFFGFVYVWARYGQKTNFAAKFWVPYISGLGGCPSPKI